MDPKVGTSVPAALVSYRTLVDDYPASEGQELALDRFGQHVRRLETLRDLEAQVLHTLAMRIPQSDKDAAWRAGEIYEKKLKNTAKARELYALVPEISPHYRDAQKKLQR